MKSPGQRLAQLRPVLTKTGLGLLLALIAAIVFWPFLTHPDLLLAPRSGLGTDISYRHWPDLTGYTRALREYGQIPLWDDSVALGRPLAGDPGVLWLYPFDLVFLILPPPASFTVLAVSHVLIAGLLAMWFCRLGLQTSQPAAWRTICKPWSGIWGIIREMKSRVERVGNSVTKQYFCNCPESILQALPVPSHGILTTVVDLA
jgi:hypothetical protein